MGYSVKNLKEALQTSSEFCDIINANGYGLVDGSCQAFWFEKQISKSIDGAEESFTLSVYNQISGLVSATLSYRKKLRESSDILKIEQIICSDAKKLDDKIRVCEQKCLSVGKNFI